MSLNKITRLRYLLTSRGRVHRSIHQLEGLRHGVSVRDILRDARLYLRSGRVNHARVHGLDLCAHVGEMVTRVVNEYDAHDRDEIGRVLVVDRDTGLVLEVLADGALKEIDVELAKE